MAATACVLCEKSLSNGIDTFGDWNFPMCWDCYAAMNGEGGDAWYGLAPHHHDMSITGSVIGSTVFDPLPEPNEWGDYDLGDRTFTPDPDAPGCGIWARKVVPGWR